MKLSSGARTALSALCLIAAVAVLQSCSDTNKQAMQESLDSMAAEAKDAVARRAMTPEVLDKVGMGLQRGISIAQQLSALGETDSERAALMLNDLRVIYKLTEPYKDQNDTLRALFNEFDKVTQGLDFPREGSAGSDAQ